MERSAGQARLQGFLQIAFPLLIGFVLLLLVLAVVLTFNSELSARKRGNLYFLLLLPWLGMLLQNIEWVGYTWGGHQFDEACYWWALYWFGRPLFSLPITIFSLRLTILVYGYINLNLGFIKFKRSMVTRHTRFGATWMIVAMFVGLIPFMVCLPPLCALGSAVLQQVDYAHVTFQACIILVLIFDLFLLSRKSGNLMKHHVTATMVKAMFGITLILIYGFLLDNVGWAFLDESQEMTGGLLVFINYASQTILMFFFWWKTYRAFCAAGKGTTNSSGTGTATKGSTKGSTTNSRKTKRSRTKTLEDGQTKSPGGTLTGSASANRLLVSGSRDDAYLLLSSPSPSAPPSAAPTRRATLVGEPDADVTPITVNTHAQDLFMN